MNEPLPVNRPPALDPADVYVYLHDNGAILVYEPDGGSRFVALAEAVEVAAACGARGGEVYLGAESDRPMVQQARDAVIGAGARIVDHTPIEPPFAWPSDTTALMSAASYGQDALLDDLLERGASVHVRDESGATALHHAAGNGNLHAVGRLTGAGADLEVRNHAGLTPHMVALACRQHAAAARLEASGASPSLPDERLTFRRIHYLPVLLQIIAPFAVFVPLMLSTWPYTISDAVIIAAFVVVFAVINPGRLFWRSGGVPRRLDGHDLTLRTVTGRLVKVELDRCPVAAYGVLVGALHGRVHGSRLVLVHPAGRPASRRALRRLLIPKHELDDLVRRADRVIVVILDCIREHEVLRPVGNLLSTSGTDLSPTLRHRLALARNRDPTKGYR